MSEHYEHRDVDWSDHYRAIGEFVVAFERVAFTLRFSYLRAKVDRIVKRVADLVEARNEVVHGEWLIGPDVVVVSDSADLPDTHGFRRKPSKAGIKVKDLRTIAALDELTAECRLLDKQIKDICAAILIEVHNEERQRKTVASLDAIWDPRRDPSPTLAPLRQQIGSEPIA